MTNKQDPMDDHSFLTFHLAGEQFAVGLCHVKEIIPYGTVTKVPQAPQFIRGVINLRGSVVGIVDLARKFTLAASPITNRTCIIILELTLDDESMITGIVADSVSQVIDLSAPDILPVPSFGTCVTAGFLRGMAKADDKFLLILDIEKALSDREMIQSKDSSASRNGVAPSAE